MSSNFVNKYYEKKAFTNEWKKDYLTHKLYMLNLVLIMCILLPLVLVFIGLYFNLIVFTIIGVVSFIMLFFFNRYYGKKKLTKYLANKYMNINNKNGISVFSYYPVYVSLDNKKMIIKENNDIIFECSKNEYSHSILMIDYSKKLEKMEDISSKNTIFSLMIYKKNYNKPFIIDLNVFLINNKMKRVKDLFITSNVKTLLNAKKEINNW